MLFMLQRIGWGRHKPALEYIYHLKHIIKKGGVALDIGANLGYYTRTLSKVVGDEGRVFAVEPVPPIFEVLKRNNRRCRNVELYNVALGVNDTTITMANDSVGVDGYFGTGQNFVKERDTKEGEIVEFEAQMRRGSELFGDLERLDFVKCDIEGYEVVVMGEIRPLLEHHRPVVLIETGGENRTAIIDMFTEMGYQGYTLESGREVALTVESTKDIIFRP